MHLRVFRRVFVRGLELGGSGKTSCSRRQCSSLPARKTALNPWSNLVTWILTCVCVCVCSARPRRSAVLPGVSVHTHARSGAYDIVATKVLDQEELATPTILTCELRVPSTNYTRLKSLVYYPGKAPAA